MDIAFGPYGLTAKADASGVDLKVYVKDNSCLGFKAEGKAIVRLLCFWRVVRYLPSSIRFCWLQLFQAHLWCGAKQEFY